MQIKKHRLLAAAAAVLLLMSQAILFAQKGPKDTFDFAPLNKINMPKIEKAVLANGMTILFVEDHTLPTIDIRAMVRTGGIYDPADKAGLAALTGTVMRTGGSKTMSGDDLDQLLESLGATVETGISTNSGYAYISLLKEDIDQGLEVLAGILMNPAFPEDKINLAKIEAKSFVSRRNDDVGTIARREFNKLIYGAGHPYARHPEYETLDAVTRDDMVSFYKQYFHPNNMIFAAWGDFNWKELKEKFESYFGSWEKAPLTIPAKPEVDYTFDYSVNYIEKNDVNQSNILLGHIGGTMDNPDYPALLIMNQILSFDRMFKKIRTDEGLAYSVWGSYGAGYDHKGVFSAGCQTKAESTVRAIQLMLKELKRIQAEPVTDAELQKAKDMYLNGFVFNFDSKAKIVNRLLRYTYFGFPEDFMTSVKNKVEQVTAADVQRAAKQYLNPDNVRILIVGNKELFDKPLSVLGTVNTIDISIPEPKESTPEATQESLARGKQILAGVTKALGGADAVSSIKSMKTGVTIAQTTPMGDMNLEGSITMVYPDKMKAAIQSPMGEVNIIISGDKGKMIVPGRGEMALPPAQMKTYKESILRDPVYFLSMSNGISAQYIGTEAVEGSQCHDILLTVDSFQFHLFTDMATNLPAAVVYTSVGPQGPQKVREVFSDYKTVQGIKVAMKTVSYNADDGTKQGENTVKDIVFNSAIDMTVFEF